MKTIKIAEATGPALDWLVAKALGELEAEVLVGEATTQAVIVDDAGSPFSFRIGAYFKPSTDWSQGGPIIDAMMKEGLTLSRGGPCSGNTRCWAKLEGHPGLYSGPTPLISAMRCYCSSKLGETAEVPEELA